MKTALAITYHSFAARRHDSGPVGARPGKRIPHFLWIAAALALLPGGALPSSAQHAAKRPPKPTPAEIKLRLNKALLDAVAHGDADLASFLLTRGADPNSRNGAGKPALMLAFTADKSAEEPASPTARRATVQALLNAGANVNCQDEQDVTPLMLAVKGYDMELIDALLKRKPRIDQAEKEGNTALILACMSANELAVRELLDHGANINAANKKGLTPIGGAIISPSVQGIAALMGAMAGMAKLPASGVFKLLVDRGADLKVKTSDGITLLMIAAGIGNEDATAFLLTHGLDVNARGNQGINALLAVLQTKARIVKLLLAHGADPNLAATDGSTPLMIAANRGSYAITERLLKSGATPSARRADGLTALMTAQRNMNTAIANLLKQSGAQE